MNPALEMAIKRLWKSLAAAIVPIVLSVLIQYVSDDPIFRQQSAMVWQGILVALLLALQKYWKEKNNPYV